MTEERTREVIQQELEILRKQDLTPLQNNVQRVLNTLIGDSEMGTEGLVDRVNKALKAFDKLEVKKTIDKTETIFEWFTIAKKNGELKLLERLATYEKTIVVLYTILAIMSASNVIDIAKFFISLIK